jgi:hypothetical protein
MLERRPACLTWQSSEEDEALHYTAFPMGIKRLGVLGWHLRGMDIHAHLPMKQTAPSCDSYDEVAS